MLRMIMDLYSLMLVSVFIYLLTLDYTKAHLPLRKAFTLGTQPEKKRDNQHEIYLPNAKTLGPQRNLYSIDWHWCLAIGLTQILGLASGVTQIFAFLDTNMLVSPMPNSDIGGLDHRRPNSKMLRRSGI